jgi:sialate O-acetylesterase
MRGVIWYQGENNITEDQDATGYVAKKKTLIDGWRALWGYGFPFYYAQLAPYAYSENDRWNVEAGVLPLFWEAQSAVLGEVTNVGMAVASDHLRTGHRQHRPGFPILENRRQHPGNHI